MTSTRTPVPRGLLRSVPIFAGLDASSADALLLAVQFQLEPLDVVYVAATRLADWNRVMTQLLPTIQGLWQSVDLSNRAAQAVQEN